MEILKLDEQIKHAKSNGALYHPTNPKDAWFCVCGVFGRGGSECWSCESQDIYWQYVPRFGGGAQQSGPSEGEV